MKGGRKVELEKTKKDQGESGNETIAVVRSFLINEEGVLVRRKKNEKLPEIIVELPPVYGGEKIKGEGMRVTLQLLKKLKEKPLAIKLVEIYDDSLMILVLEDETRVFYNSLVDPTEIAFSLQTLLSSFKIEGKKVSEIDFRFGKPVVRF